MQRILRLSVTAVLAGAIVLIVPSAGGAALPPNDSVFFYKAGSAAMTGTIINGTYTVVNSSLDVGTGWTAATMGRDTLVLLNSSNGHLRFATLTAGNYTFVTDNVSITRTFTKLSASCDSILFYSPSNGKVLTSKLGGGNLDATHLHTYTVAKNFTSVNASCNTVTFLNNKGAGIIGTLEAGKFVKKGSLKTGMPGPQVAHTDSSFMRFSFSADSIEWGTSNNGAEHVTFGPKDKVVRVSKIGGTASSALLYDATTGDGSTAELLNGQTSNAHSQHFGPGWQIIVGGR
jgi:hypothetical protein